MSISDKSLNRFVTFEVPHYTSELLPHIAVERGATHVHHVAITYFTRNSVGFFDPACKYASLRAVYKPNNQLLTLQVKKSSGEMQSLTAFDFKRLSFEGMDVFCICLDEYIPAKLGFPDPNFNRADKSFRIKDVNTPQFSSVCFDLERKRDVYKLDISNTKIQFTACLVPNSEVQDLVTWLGPPKYAPYLES